MKEFEASEKIPNHLKQRVHWYQKHCDDESDLDDENDENDENAENAENEKVK